MNLNDLTPIQELHRGLCWMRDDELFGRSPSIQRRIFFDLVRLQDTWGPVAPVTVAQEITKPYRGHSERWHYKAMRAGVQ